MPSDIILIGPMGAGKSTIGKLLSRKLGLPCHEMDGVRWKYFKEQNFEKSDVVRLLETEGTAALYRHWKPLEAYSVERLLSEHSNCIFAFGGGHSVYEDDALFQKVQRILEPYDNVVLLLPSPDLDESVRLLREQRQKPSLIYILWRMVTVGLRTLARGKLPRRLKVYKGGEQLDLFEHFVRHHSNYDLAKIVVYTKEKTPEETCQEILSRITLPEALRCRTPEKGL